MRLILFSIALCLSLSSCEVLSSLSSNEETNQASSPDRGKELFQRKFYEAQKEKALDNPEKAFALFQECIDIDPSVSAVYYEMGRIEKRRNNDQNAVLLFESAIKLESDNKWYLLEMAETKQSLGKYDDAVSFYSKAIDLDPKDREIYKKMARNQEYANDFQGAVKTYDELEKWSGIEEEISFKKMDHYLMLGKNDQAEKELLNLIEYNPDEIRYMGMLAEFYTGIGKKEEALVQYEKMRSLEPNNGMLHWQLAQHYMRIGELSKSHDELLKAFASDDVSLQEKNDLIQSLMMDSSNQFTEDEFLELAKILEEKGKNDSSTQSVLAQVYIEKGDMESANKKLRKAVNSKNASIDSWRRLLLTDYLLSDFDAMKTDADAVLELYPLQPEFFLYSGFSKFKKDELNKAVISLKTGSQFVIEDEAISAVFSKVLSCVYKKEKNLTKEQESEKKSLEKAALVTYSEVDEMGLEIKFGRTLVSMSRPFLAFSWYEILLENKTNELDALIDIGDLHFDLGNKKGALRHWKKALELDPTNVELKSKLDQVNE